jgi:cytidine deaminase
MRDSELERPVSAEPATHKPSGLTAAEREALLHAARTARTNAYARYSNFRVGAAVLTEAGILYTGCNVENASYGLTNCAERTAIFSAVAAEGPAMRLRALAVLSDPECACAPCGACRQVISEFGPEAIVLYRGSEGIEERRASELLPAGFVL